ncbi:MAG: spermidine synthase [Candidatus Polarisedimenticolia bacterium]
MSRSLVILAVFLVNACSLVFEVVASRKAATFLGATAQANAVLLAAFLAGIGLGGWAASMGVPGRLSRRCAWLLAAGALLSAALSPSLTWLGGVMPAVLALRAMLLCLMVVPVGMAVGYSYPALTTMHSAGSALGRSTASTYAADTLGAAAGAIAAGLFLIPALGLRATGVLAGAGLALSALLLFRANSKPGEPSRRSQPGQQSSWILSLFFATGAAALVLEVAWIRLFTLVIGTSTFSFALTVAAFLAALGVGSQLMRGRIEAVTDLRGSLGALLLLVGGTAPALLVISPVWERLYLAAYGASSGAWLFQSLLFLLGLASIIIPAGAMGAGFSLGVKLLAAASPEPGNAVARLYGLNTLGGVLGALAGGLVLIPLLGLRATVLAAAGIYIVCGWWVGPMSRQPSLRTAFAVSMAVVPAIGLFLPEPQASFAAYYHGLRFNSFEEFRMARAKESVLYRGFSAYGVTTVTQDASYRYLRHNGRSEASNAPGDVSTQSLIGHLPLLMHAAPSQVLNIGLGAGFTLAAIAHHPQVKVITQAELDPQIAFTAKRFFSDLNDNAMNDPRLTLNVTDGRMLLNSSPQTYDVIISEPSHLWVSGVSGLFTTEFYALVRSRLQPGGIFATWVPDYEMGPEDIHIVAATLLDVFPNVVAFENGPSDIIFLASISPLRPSIERVAESLAVPSITTDISRALEGFPLSSENLHDLLSQLATTSEAMAASVTPNTPRNTDDWPVLEFHTAMAAISKRQGMD